MEGRAPWDKTPVEILATFVLSRPKSHFGRGGVVRESAPLSPVTTPDLDKLIRGVLDAMSGPVYKDDSCVVTVHAAKVYGESEGLMVSVRPDERLWYHEEHVALNLSHRSKLVLV